MKSKYLIIPFIVFFLMIGGCKNDESAVEEAPQGRADSSVKDRGEGRTASESTSGRGGAVGGQITVDVGILKKQDFDFTYYTIGTLEASNIVRANPLKNGTAEKVYVRVGDFVEEGDPLVSLEKSTIIDDLERANEKWDYQLELLNITREEANEKYETAKSFYDRDLISASEYQQAQNTWEKAELQYNIALNNKKAEIENIQKNLSDTLVISPARGYISEISFSEREIIGTTDYIEIITVDPMHINFQISENFINRISIGLAIRAKQAGAPEFLLEGEIIQIGIKADTNRTYAVIAEIINPRERLKPGMLMELEIYYSFSPQRFMVPKETIIVDCNESYIYLIKESKAIKVPVESVASRHELVVVDGQLSEGDQFVLRGQTYLDDGVSVTVGETVEYLPSTYRGVFR